MAEVLKGLSMHAAGATRLIGVARALPPAPPAKSAGVSAPLPPAPAPAAVAAAPVDPAQLAAELDALRRRAQEEGLEQGRRNAQAQVEAALARQEAAWRTAIESLEASAERRLQALEAFGVAVAFEACASVLGDAAVDADAVTAVVRRLLASARGDGLLRVQLPQADVEVVRRALAHDAQWQQRSLRIETGRDLGPGECRVETSHGQLETSLPSRLAAIQETLLATFAGRARAVKEAP
jgi:flagellar biosynthesis/type III secretory pathway protein FliH